MERKLNNFFAGSCLERVTAVMVGTERGKRREVGINK
jgi:hypothetical protein